MLTVTRDGKRTLKLKRPRGRPHKRFIEKVDFKNENKMIEILFIALNTNIN